MDKEAKKHINWLELRAARLVLFQLASPSDVVQLNLHNMMAIAFIRNMGVAQSPTLCKKSDSQTAHNFSLLSG